MCYVTTKNAKWRRSALPRALGAMPNGAKSKNMRSPHIQQIYLYSTKVALHVKVCILLRWAYLNLTKDHTMCCDYLQ